MSDTSVRHIEIEWGPTIAAAARTGCGACVDSCHNDVCRWSEDEIQVVVAFKTHCVTGCSHCGTLCEPRLPSDHSQDHQDREQAEHGRDTEDYPDCPLVNWRSGVCPERLPHLALAIGRQDQ